MRVDVATGDQLEVHPELRMGGSCPTYPDRAADGMTVAWGTTVRLVEDGRTVRQVSTGRVPLDAALVDGGAEDVSVSGDVVYRLRASSVEAWNTTTGSTWRVTVATPDRNGTFALGGHHLYWLSWDEPLRLIVVDLRGNATLVDDLPLTDLGLPGSVRGFAAVGARDQGLHDRGGLRDGAAFWALGDDGAGLDHWVWSLSTRTATNLGQADWLADGGAVLYLGNSTSTREVDLETGTTRVLAPVVGTVSGASEGLLYVRVGLARAMQGHEMKPPLGAELDADGAPARGAPLALWGVLGALAVALGMARRRASGD